MSLGVLSLLQFLGGVSERLALTLKCLLNPPGKPSTCGLFFVGKFLIFALIIDLFKFPISSWFSLGRLYLLIIYTFLVGYLICWSVIVHGSLLWSFVFLWYQYISSFISDFESNISLLIFLSGWYFCCWKWHIKVLYYYYVVSFSLQIYYYLIYIFWSFFIGKDVLVPSYCFLTVL